MGYQEEGAQVSKLPSFASTVACAAAFESNFVVVSNTVTLAKHPNPITSPSVGSLFVPHVVTSAGVIPAIAPFALVSTNEKSFAEEQVDAVVVA